jgi:hypothetical protein
MSISNEPKLFALTILSLAILTACQTSPSNLGTTGTEERVAALTTEDEYKKSYTPVFVSRSDVFTELTKTTIENNNNIYFCRFPDRRPEGFDVAICAFKP